MNFNKIITLKLLTIIALVTACGVDNPPNPNEEELITTVELNFTDTTTNEVRSFRFADPDGIGGNDPTQLDTVVLDTQAAYTLSVRFLDESKSPAVNITEEIEEEAADHMVCYTQNGSLTIEVLDEDSNGLPLGLQSRISTGVKELGDLTLSLKHQPDVKTGDCAAGETDVEVKFPVKVE